MFNQQQDALPKWMDVTTQFGEKLRSKRRITRSILALAMMIGGLALVGVAGTGAASASTCNLVVHCYGNTAGIGEGGYAEIARTCLYAPPGNFVTEEMWLSTIDSKRWVEAGFISINDLQISGDTKKRTEQAVFYANQTPTSWSFHIIEEHPAATTMTLELYYSSTNTYTLIANTTNHHQVSMVNSMSRSLMHLILGSESTSPYSHSMNTGKYIQTEISPTSWLPGVRGPAQIINSPQTFTWVSKPTSYKSGISCTA
jgi:hypothetical protein